MFFRFKTIMINAIKTRFADQNDFWYARESLTDFTQWESWVTCNKDATKSDFPPYFNSIKKNLEYYNLYPFSTFFMEEIYLNYPLLPSLNARARRRNPEVWPFSSIFLCYCLLLCGPVWVSPFIPKQQWSVVCVCDLLLLWAARAKRSLLRFLLN